MPPIIDFRSAIMDHLRAEHGWKRGIGLYLNSLFKEDSAKTLCRRIDFNHDSDEMKLYINDEHITTCDYNTTNELVLYFLKS